jgi:hypothetical protein
MSEILLAIVVSNLPQSPFTRKGDAVVFPLLSNAATSGKRGEKDEFWIGDNSSLCKGRVGGILNVTLMTYILACLTQLD